MVDDNSPDQTGDIANYMIPFQNIGYRCHIHFRRFPVVGCIENVCRDPIACVMRCIPCEDNNRVLTPPQDEIRRVLKMVVEQKFAGD